MQIAAGNGCHSWRRARENYSRPSSSHQEAAAIAVVVEKRLAGDAVPLLRLPRRPPVSRLPRCSIATQHEHLQALIYAWRAAGEHDVLLLPSACQITRCSLDNCAFTGPSTKEAQPHATGRSPKPTHLLHWGLGRWTWHVVPPPLADRLRLRLLHPAQVAAERHVQCRSVSNVTPCRSVQTEV